MSDELRGSTPIYTAKDILIRVESKVDALDSKVDDLHTSVEILTSQQLAARISRLESWQQRVIGMAAISTVLAAVAAVLSFLNTFPVK